MLVDLDANQRRILVFTSAAHFLTHFFVLVFPALVMPISRDLSLEPARVIPLSFPMYLCYGILAIPWGYLSDRFGPRWMMGAGHAHRGGRLHGRGSVRIRGAAHHRSGGDRRRLLGLSPLRPGAALQGHAGPGESARHQRPVGKLRDRRRPAGGGDAHLRARLEERASGRSASPGSRWVCSASPCPSRSVPRICRRERWWSEGRP